MPEFTPSRRTALGLGAAAAIPALLSACGGTEDTDSASGDSDGGGGTDAGYPVTVETSYGPITLEQRPERVVAIGGSYTDQLIALGVQPIAYVGSPRAGEDFAAAYPWLATTELDPAGHDLALLAEGYAPSLEAVAAHEPDLIIGDGEDWAIDAAMYEEMSLIAPTYTPPFEATEKPAQWEQMLADIAALTGTAELTEDIVAEADASVEEARGALAGLQGASYVYGDVREQELGLSGEVYQLERLGLSTDTELVAQGSLSLERLDEVTSDVFYVMVWRAEDVQETLESDPRFEELPATQGGTVVFADAVLTNALEPGPLAMSYWMQEMVTRLEDSPRNTEGS